MANEGAVSGGKVSKVTLTVDKKQGANPTRKGGCPTNVPEKGG